MIWKDIEGYEGMYQVSDEGGLCKSLGRIDSLGRIRKEKILKPTFTHKVYGRVTLCKDNEKNKFEISRLIAFTINGIPNELKDTPKEELDVHHKDGNPLNNDASNLLILSKEQHLELHRKSETTSQRKRDANTGKHHSEDTKRKLSEINKGENNPNWGKHRSEETKNKTSKAMKAFYEKKKKG